MSLMDLDFTEYVIVYAKSVDLAEDKQRIPMVLKNRPAYLAGMLNLPGGKIEEGEDPLDAAVRELKEETGLEDLGVTDGMCPCGPENMGMIVDYQSKIKIHCIMVPITFRQELKPQDGETEPVDWYDASTLLRHPKLMPNLRLIIPFMDAGFKGWQLLCHHDWNGDMHTIDLLCDGSKSSWEFAVQVTVPGKAFYIETNNERK